MDMGELEISARELLVAFDRAYFKPFSKLLQNSLLLLVRWKSQF
jgi:hypothetical protein